MWQRKLDKLEMFGKEGGSRCLFMHVLYADRHIIGYNDVAGISCSFCNIRVWVIPGQNELEQMIILSVKYRCIRMPHMCAQNP